MAGNEASRVHLRGLSGTYKGREYPLNKDEFTIGRLSGSDLFLDDSTISARHACIRRVGGGYEVSDLRSTNGTCVNGKRIERQRLRADDIIRFDVHEFLFINPVDVSRTIISAVSGETVWYQKTAPEGHPRPIVMAESVSGAQPRRIVHHPTLSPQRYAK